MRNIFFVSDLHGHIDRYEKLFRAIRQRKPDAVFLGGDLLPHGILPGKSLNISHKDFTNNFLRLNLQKLKVDLAEDYPEFFVILGNDDARFGEASILDVAAQKLLNYVNNRRIKFDEYFILGYAFVPPTPFRLKDWERYDVSRYTDPGCIAPPDGFYTVEIRESEKKYGTIQKDLQKFSHKNFSGKTICLFHSPPYQTKLDRAALDGRKIDHVPLDPHIGSIAIRKFIEEIQPLLTLHGHVHESARLTGSWQDRIGNTFCFNAAHDGAELAIIFIDLEFPENAVRELI